MAVRRIQAKGSGKTGYGVCFVIIGLAVSLPGISNRVFCLPFAARLWLPPNAEVKPEAIPYRTKPEIGLELIKLTHSWLEEGQTLRVVGDNAYTCETIIKGRPEGVHITGKLRTDACLYGVPVSPPKKQRGRAHDFLCGMRQQLHRRLWRHGRRLLLELVAKLIDISSKR